MSVTKPDIKISIDIQTETEADAVYCNHCGSTISDNAKRVLYPKDYFEDRDSVDACPSCSGSKNKSDNVPYKTQDYDIKR